MDDITSSPIAHRAFAGRLIKPSRAQVKALFTILGCEGFPYSVRLSTRAVLLRLGLVVEVPDCYFSRYQITPAGFVVLRAADAERVGRTLECISRDAHDMDRQRYASSPVPGHLFDRWTSTLIDIAGKIVP